MEEDIFVPDRTRGIGVGLRSTCEEGSGWMSDGLGVSAMRFNTGTWTREVGLSTFSSVKWGLITLEGWEKGGSVLYRDGNTRARIFLLWGGISIAGGGKDRVVGEGGDGGASEEVARRESEDAALRGGCGGTGEFGLVENGEPKKALVFAEEDGVGVW
jgi:hypothetical protein